jgi:hypothetical protein
MLAWKKRRRSRIRFNRSNSMATGLSWGGVNNGTSDGRKHRALMENLERKAGWSEVIFAICIIVSGFQMGWDLAR